MARDVLVGSLFLAAAFVPQTSSAQGAGDGGAIKSPYGVLTLGESKDFSHDLHDLKVPTGPGRSKLYYRLLAHREALQAGLPADLVDAVMRIESSYDPSRIGSVGEIGLMQVRPATAAMLGFKGTPIDLARPEINIHYGAAYLGQAWHLTKGDVCRTLMKYRAGHGETRMTPLSELYCQHARAHLLEIGSPLAVAIQGQVTAAVLLSPPNPIASLPRSARRRALHGTAFWAAEEAHVKTVMLRLHAKWHLTAMRDP